MTSFNFKRFEHETLNSDGEKVNYWVSDPISGIGEPTMIQVDWRTDKTGDSVAFVGNDRVVVDEEKGYKYYLEY